MTPLKILFWMFAAMMQVWLALDFFQGKIFSGWVGIAFGIVMLITAALNFRDAARPLLGSLLTLVGNRK